MLHGLEVDHDLLQRQLREIAASIGSDVPFFLGDTPTERDGDNPISAARARGRGERIEAIDLTPALNCVVVFPGVSLSTGKVYADSRVPQNSQNACRLMEVLRSGDLADLKSQIYVFHYPSQYSERYHLNGISNTTAAKSLFHECLKWERD